MEWYKFFPVDTLYFKGADPMVMGENHTASYIFPPPAHTISGALRTAVLLQNGVSIKDYSSDERKAPTKIYDAIGEPGRPAPFNIIGPLFLAEEDIYVPAPYSWFVEKGATSGQTEVIKGRLIESPLLKCSRSHFFWAKGKAREVVSAGGMWAKAQDLNSQDNLVTLKKDEDFFENELRTGIALQQNRKVRKGHLYSFNHARLKKTVSLLFGTDVSLPLNDKGVLRLGAEQRFGWYEKVAEEHIQFPNEGDLYMSLSIVEGTQEANEAVIATGKIQYFGGWDLHKGFHKPMKGYFPAGTVFNKKVNTNCIRIKGD